ncbi:MAG: hypothetical protein K8I30_13640 [Anaerolineae bacterium]|nr:hypothetical protein [Anaerolineae bacterium]
MQVFYLAMRQGDSDTAFNALRQIAILLELDISLVPTDEWRTFLSLQVQAAPPVNLNPIWQDFIETLDMRAIEG